MVRKGAWEAGDKDFIYVNIHELLTFNHLPYPTFNISNTIQSAIMQGCKRKSKQDSAGEVDHDMRYHSG